MLHVERGVHIDAGIAKLFHVLPAFGVTHPRRVGVREFVDQQQGRTSCERRIEIELVDIAAWHGGAIRDAIEPLEQPLGFGAPVRLHVAHHHIDAFRVPAPSRFEHRVGFADARRGAKEDLELAASQPCFLCLHVAQQRVGIIATFDHRAQRCVASDGCGADGSRRWYRLSRDDPAPD